VHGRGEAGEPRDPQALGAHLLGAPASRGAR
jgi:hypothetical protein